MDLVSTRTGVLREILDTTSRLETDLGLDSFGLLELAASLTDLGANIEEREWLEAGTIGGLYACYRERIGSFSAPAGETEAETAGGSESLVGPPQLAGQFFRLVPVHPQAAPFLYDLAVSPDVGFRWRYRGSVPPFAQFENDLWQGVFAQFLVESVQTSQPAGHVMCYNADLNLGHAYVGAAMAGQYLGSGIAAEPVQLFVSYLFDVWPLRKLYLELPEFNFTQFASAIGRGLSVEARLRGHDYYRGRRWDRLILAIYRPGQEPAFSGEFAG
ncbi:MULTISPECIES: phosphopantetheine-binding protein [unclassified Frankia]|uniref:phosphopantetheine-binding protein n=1 Tax=unclassified Frankia TaxID=2632575 RepID=UPI0027DCC2E3|nr:MULTISPECIES: phosphopantetheine-binding protein [unclassified Frankia]